VPLDFKVLSRAASIAAAFGAGWKDSNLPSRQKQPGGFTVKLTQQCVVPNPSLVVGPCSLPDDLQPSPVEDWLTSRALNPTARKAGELGLPADAWALQRARSCGLQGLISGFSAPVS
jgi:hypothetical protein